MATNTRRTACRPAGDPDGPPHDPAELHATARQSLDEHDNEVGAFMTRPPRLSGGELKYE
jgi:hypothetical protein